MQQPAPPATLQQHPLGEPHKMLVLPLLCDADDFLEYVSPQTDLALSKFVA